MFVCFLQPKKINEARQMLLKNTHCPFQKEDPECTTLPLMEMRVKSLILLQWERLEHIVTMISVYVLSSPRVSHQQQLRKLFFCHFHSADKNT